MTDPNETTDCAAALLTHIDDNFFADSWSRREAKIECLADILSLFSVSDLEVVLNRPYLQYPMVRVTDSSGAVDPVFFTRSTGRYFDPRIAPEKLSRQLRAGRTVRVNNLQDYDDGVGLFARRIMEFFQSPVTVNAYYILGPAKGIRPHYDSHHVFTVQLYGAKLWRLGPIVVDTPGPEYEPYPTALPPGTKSCRTVAGDVLYLPPGMWHATECEEASLHLAVGIRMTTWSAVVDDLLKFSAQRHPIFRAHIPFSVNSDRTGITHSENFAEDIPRLLDLLRDEVAVWLEHRSSKTERFCDIPKTRTTE